MMDNPAPERNRSDSEGVVEGRHLVIRPSTTGSLRSPSAQELYFLKKTLCSFVPLW